MTDLRLEQTIDVDIIDIPVDFPPPDLKLYRFSVQKCHTMIEAGILTEDQNIELLEGWLVNKIPKNPPHSTVKRRISIMLTPLLPEGWMVHLEDPITTRDSEPEPDATVVKGTFGDFEQRHPAPAEIALVSEVSDTSLNKDRTIKQRIYARAGISIYWLINLEARKLEVYTQPGGSGASARYAHRVELGEGANAEVVLEGAVVGTIVVAQLLPKATE